MSATLLPGARTWKLDRDDDGYRNYGIGWLVNTSSYDDGPLTVMNCPGLPTVGSIWNFGNDLDEWAFCWPTMSISIHEEKEGDPSKNWYVQQKFTNKPYPSKRCQDEQIEDPLLEPQKVSGNFVKYTQEVVRNLNGFLILSSSHELLRGPQVEFDHNKPTVRIEQNVPTLGLETFSGMVDTVNDLPMWGLPARCVKLSNVTWERKVYGTCDFYYTRAFDFDIDSRTFDRQVLDEGTKVLNGYWAEDSAIWRLLEIGGSPPDPDNPSHFVRYKDRNGENANVILNGAGLPASTAVQLADANPSDRILPGVGTTGGAGTINIAYYPESNFFILDIPTDF